MTETEIVNTVKNALISASSTFRQDKKEAYQNVLNMETNKNAKAVLSLILENVMIAEKRRSPLCDDTGIPHLVLEVGMNAAVSGKLLYLIEKGVSEGLRELPGRPMAVLGNDRCRIDQSMGLDANPEGVIHAPILIRRTKDNVLRLHLLMLGGGPAIRAKTYRVFHNHNTEEVIDKIVEWSKEMVEKIGCTPCTLAVGVGRSHFEASSMMLLAQIEGNYLIQSDMEKEITERINTFDIGPLGLHGKTTILATFMKVGPQRASGVRIVCIRPCCCFEPRIATVDLTYESL